MTRVGFRLIGNVEVGRDVTHAELASRYHAVIYAVGAMSDRPLGIPGETLAGSHSATEFVAWYNGHPDHAHRAFDLSGERAVVIGNGNVALDVARVLLGAGDALRRTDIADRALESLARSRIREVVIVGRRGPAEAAFTTPELLGLLDLPDVDVVVPARDLPRLADPSLATLPATDKQRLLHGLGERPARGGKRIVLRFLHSPTRLLGERCVEGIELARNEIVRDGGRAVARATAERTELACRLVLRAVGYRGSPIPDLPFDEARAALPHSAGRVIDPASAQPLAGVYATGWIKRGPSGVIGTNKVCAQETVSALLADFDAGRLAAPTETADVVGLAGQSTDLAGWMAIDEIERRAGRQAERPRIKIVERERLLELARRR